MALQKDRLKRILLLIHITLAVAVLIAGIVEFAVEPPLFDVAGDRIGIKDHVFQNDQRTPKDDIRRLMDIPVLLNILIYFGCCLYLRFSGLSFILTVCAYGIVFSFLLVNFWADNYFSWNYMSSRSGGMLLMVVAITVSSVANAVVISWKRQKLYFEFRARKKDVHRLTRLTILRESHDYGPAELQEPTDSGQVVIRKNAWVSVLWNVIALSIITCLCLIIWFSRMYMSYGCFSSHSEVLLLCEITSEVECYPCSNCSSEGIVKCGKTSTNMFHCLSQLQTSDPDQGAVCLFNYNIGFFTFLLVFADIGGIYFVLMRLTHVLTNLFIQNVYRLYVRYLRFYHSWRHGRRYTDADMQPIAIVQAPDSV